MVRGRSLSNSGSHQFKSLIEYEDWDTIRSKLSKENDPTGTWAHKRCTKIYHQNKTALHLACQHHPPDDILLSILNANPSAASVPSQPHGELPLHFATGFHRHDRHDRHHAAAGHNLNASLGVIQHLVTAYPASIAARTTYGVTPLHQACTFRAPYEVIRVMVEAFPEALHVEDEQGRTPWDIAKVTYFIFNPVYWKILYLLSSSAPVSRSKGKLHSSPNSKMEGARV